MSSFQKNEKYDSTATYMHIHTHTTARTVGTLSVLQSARGREGQVIEWKPFFPSPAWCGFRVEAGAVTREPLNSEGIAVTLVLQAHKDREGFLPMPHCNAFA